MTFDALRVATEDNLRSGCILKTTSPQAYKTQEDDPTEADAHVKKGFKRKGKYGKKSGNTSGICCGDRNREVTQCRHRVKGHKANDSWSTQPKPQGKARAKPTPKSPSSVNTWYSQLGSFSPFS